MALHTAIGDLLTLSGLYAAALTSYEQAAALSAPADLGTLEHKLGSVYHRQGEWGLAASHFQAALNGLGGSAPAEARARLYADWSLAAHQGGDAAHAQPLAQQALNLAEVADDTRALAQVHNLLGILAGAQGELGAARQHLERSLALADELGDPAIRVAARNNLALAYGNAEAYGPAVLLVEQALALCAAQGDRHREAALHNNLADLLHASGQAEAALRHVKQSVIIYAEIGSATGAGPLQPEIWKLVAWYEKNEGEASLIKRQGVAAVVAQRSDKHKIESGPVNFIDRPALQVVLEAAAIERPQLDFSASLRSPALLLPAAEQPVKALRQEVPGERTDNDIAGVVVAEVDARESH